MYRLAALLWRRLATTLGWTRSSYFLMSGFLATLMVIGIIWWPLARDVLSYVDWSRPLWLQVDWLLLSIFATMSLLIMAGADLQADALIVFVGLVGGLVIESWGTQTELWVYYTRERPPLWIIPAWPIASLSIDRLTRLLNRLAQRVVPISPISNLQPPTSNLQPPISDPQSPISYRISPILYWTIFPAFYALMLAFVWPTRSKSLTVMALILCGLLTLTPTDHRLAVLTFVAGSGLGYFLERWGTTRLCWIYYTWQTPPLFAVLAHGMAAVAFWRTALLFQRLQARLLVRSQQ
jgi:hypothetical protein